MYLLVDWDNLADRDRLSGARYIAEKAWDALRRVAPAVAAATSRLDVRYYGGWRGWNGVSNPTPTATSLSGEIQAQFPFVLRNPNVTISGALAESLLCRPRQVLPHTLRHREEPPRMTCHRPAAVGCSIVSCSLSTLPDFFANRQCPEPTCGRPIQDFMTRVEQKLVDTMLVADLIHLAVGGESALGVVSSDDDLWPGLIAAIDRGTQVVHLRTKHRTSHNLYLSPNSSGYQHGAI